MGTGSSLAVEVVVRFILRFSDFFSEELLATLKLGTPKVTPIPVLTLFFFFFGRICRGSNAGSPVEVWRPLSSSAVQFARYQPCWRLGVK